MKPNEITGLVMFVIALLLVLSVTAAIRKGKVRTKMDSHRMWVSKDNEEEAPFFWFAIIKHSVMCLFLMIGALYVYFFMK